MHIFYRPQRSCEGYVFTGVCLSTPEGCLNQCMLGYHPPSRYPPEQTPPRADTPRADTPPRADTTPPEQTTPRSRHPPGETATAADGTHPTGMHSCSILIVKVTILFSFCSVLFY